MSAHGRAGEIAALSRLFERRLKDLPATDVTTTEQLRSHLFTFTENSAFQSGSLKAAAIEAIDKFAAAHGLRLDHH